MPSIIKVDQIQSDTGKVNVSSNLQFSSGFTMLSPTLTTPTLTTPTLTTPTTSGVMTLGAGIKFPAAQVADADANTLDDYEEGSWTPTITFGGGSTGMSFLVATGTYTKIGRLVYVRANFRFSSKGSSTGNARMSLPFVAVSTSGGFSGQGLLMSGYAGFVSTSNNTLYVATDEDAASGQISFATGTTTGILTNSNFGGDSGTYFSITGCYVTST